MSRRLWIMPALLASLALIGAKQSTSVERFYDARFPRDCGAQDVSSAVREQLKSQLRSEFKKVNPAIEAIGVLEIKCALDEKKTVLGAIVLAYGAAADLDQAYEQFEKTHDIYRLLANEQYGVFQYNPSLITLRKTLTVFPSQRWRDYFATIELTSTTRLLVRANGSYGDSPLRQEFNIAW
jgi:hypothetical protein